jgi:hypothetical protein
MSVAMSKFQFVEFKVPAAEARGLNSGQWIWELSGWPGVKSASLEGLFGYLSVEATPKALKRIRAFCKERGYTEVTD